MVIRFCGGARTVTGSQYLLTINDRKILIECGLYQGQRNETYQRNKNFLFKPCELDAMLLSHAHIDHSGNIPNLVKQGFDGPIYTTSATADLCKIMLRDSAHIQLSDIEWINKRRAAKNESLIEPLYTLSDVEKSLKYFVGVEYDRSIEVCAGVTATFNDAGHILGSSGILLEIEDGKKSIRLGFSGDIGRKDTPIIRDPNFLRELDIFIMESTYGDRLHQPSGDVEISLAKIINSASERKGKVIIPAFAIGRTQRIVYLLHKLLKQNKIPSMPIYVDSPLACNATDIFRRHPECIDREIYSLFLLDTEDPFGFDRLTYIREVEKSKELNRLENPCIIIAASGMAESGRILHHLKNNIENPNNFIMFVGYAAQHTLARKMIDGEKRVPIFGEKYRVNAKVEKLDDLSAHADRDDLFDYLKFIPTEKLRILFLVHGEENQAAPLQRRIKHLGYRKVLMPRLGEQFEI